LPKKDELIKNRAEECVEKVVMANCLESSKNKEEREIKKIIQIEEGKSVLK